MRISLILVFGIICSANICCGQATWEKFKIDNRLTELKVANLRRYADSVQATTRNYSVSEIAKKFNGQDTIRLCECKMHSDTLMIRGFEWGEGGVTYRVRVKGEMFSTETVFYSDLQEYGINSDKYELVVSSAYQALTLSKRNFQTGDKIQGKLNMISVPVEHLGTKPIIEFDGIFQCIVE